MKKFNKILIANRGEIALRIMRAAKTLDIKTVAVYADEERNAPHVSQADEAYSLGTGDLGKTYLNIEKMVSVAIQCGAQAIHPGYGFLSENPNFAKACTKNGIVFVGPSAEVLKQMGNKVTAKTIARKAGVKILESILYDAIKPDTSLHTLPYPLLIKAAHGGGGKGMEVVHSADELLGKATAASRAAQNYFGNGDIYIENYIENARHIEVQVLADHYGNMVHLYERDCTVQRNHQKITEEAPAAGISANLRNNLHQAALSICRETDYTNAGTVEFLVDANNDFFFLEVNPRIQVEHPVTEIITGIDIVQEQLMIAAGNPLSFTQNDVEIKGHAIEVRIYAEDPMNNFAPSGNPVLHSKFPVKEDLRVESAIDHSGNTTQYDPLLCKLAVSGIDREHARVKMMNVLEETVIMGPETNQLYLKELIGSTAFANNQLQTRFCQIEHKTIIAGIKTTIEKEEADYILAAAIIGLFASGLKPRNYWESIGYWRLNNNIDFIFNKKELSISFFIKEKKIQFSLFKNHFEYSFELIPDKNLIILNQVGEQKPFSFFKVNSASILIAQHGVVHQISTPDLLDFYPVSFSSENEDQNSNENIVRSPLHGKIVTINIEKNQKIEKGEVLLVIESMKSENAVISPKKGRIKEIAVTIGFQVSDQTPLVYLEDL